MKRASVLLLITAVCLAALLSLWYYGNRNSAVPQNTVSASSNNSSHFTAITPSSQESSEINAMASKTDLFTLKEYNGRIGVFYSGETIPYQEIDVDISSLPAADQDALKEGIQVYGTDELNRKIEDFES